MTPLRRALLRQAEAHAAMLRRCGYPDAVVAPEYCIAGEIGMDHFYTQTICVYAGEKKPDSTHPTIRKAVAAALSRLAQ